MNLYELTFMVRQELSPQQMEELTKHFQKVITDAKGKIHRTEQWGLKNLAYIINKAKKANFACMEIECDGPTIHEVERQMRLHDDVMRYMSLKLNKLSKDPSPMMKSYDRQDDMKEAA